ncbi:helix-turn-helix domain-containing protein [Thermoflavimicrobium dichotomicum]|uniref:Transcriptional regulator, contains XRE-family HTH domain n=1 Tax=Thermoflavimicrobium dichotomicum TaxID=46223 RepID=A0A1I3UGC7_9BACL|nr:helix-turn-helix transcriptional regulator [Thermoflavimicrobium dichotomicum]SFJ82534.1 Transcriptional regulator, contains XRE-family HTH domain [Thermoflavimicrobium dichotomicum]
MLGQRLKMLRGKRTQDEIAHKLGISRARYSHYENGRSEPDAEMLQKLADLYNVTTDYLLGRTDDPTPKENKSGKTGINLKEILQNPDKEKPHIDGVPITEEQAEFLIDYLELIKQRILKGEKANNN